MGLNLGLGVQLDPPTEVCAHCGKSGAEHAAFCCCTDPFCAPKDRCLGCRLSPEPEPVCTCKSASRPDPMCPIGAHGWLAAADEAERRAARRRYR